MKGNWNVWRSVEKKVLTIGKHGFRRISVNMKKKQAEDRAEFWRKHGYYSQVKPYQKKYSVLRSIKKR
jgi:hypothetical protein